MNFQEILREYQTTNPKPVKGTEYDSWLRKAVKEIGTTSSRDISVTTPSMKTWLSDNNLSHDMESHKRLTRVAIKHIEYQKKTGNLIWDNDSKKWIEHEDFEYPNMSLEKYIIV